jgi:hypothetical protein
MSVVDSRPRPGIAHKRMNKRTRVYARRLRAYKGQLSISVLIVDKLVRLIIIIVGVRIF